MNTYISKLVACTLIFYASYAFPLSYDYADFDSYQSTMSKDEVSLKIQQYLQLNALLQEYYQITDEGLNLYASPQEKLNNNPEFTLTFGSNSKPSKPAFIPSNDHAKPLAGVRIALDPGHVGGANARLKNRVVNMVSCSEANKKSDLQINLGDLNYLTAKALAEKLKAAGAQVLVTRDAIDRESYEQSFDEWFDSTYGSLSNPECVQKVIQSFTEGSHFAAKRKEWKRWATGFITQVINDPTKLADILKGSLYWFEYNKLDIQSRIEKINAFNPHMTIAIHYNIASHTEPATGKHLGTDEDYTLSFVPGGFMANELVDQPSRYEFIRLLVTEDLNNSIQFSRLITDQIASLGVEIMDDPLHVLTVAKMVEPGVYARNLDLTKLVHGAICYQMILCADNFNEAQRLAQTDTVIDGVPASSRINEVAESLYVAISRSIGLL